MMEILDLLKELGIKYDLVKHEKVKTVIEAQHIKERIEGIGCKNLFLKDKKGSYFLVVIQGDKRVDIKGLERILNVKNLSFASSSELMEILGLEEGSVTPLGIINDKDKKVTLLIDKELIDKKILVHPNRNDQTISLQYADLKKIIYHLEHRFILF